MDRFGAIFRNVVVPVCGLLGIIHETVYGNLERPSLLVLFGAMIGLPVFLAQDERRRRK